MLKLQRGPDHVVGDRKRLAQEVLPLSGFNGAPTTWSGIEGHPQPLVDGYPASTGPRPRGRGSAAAGPEARGREGASTGPRPRGRGSVEAPAAAPTTSVASTGPRPR